MMKTLLILFAALIGFHANGLLSFSGTGSETFSISLSFEDIPLDLFSLPNVTGLADGSIEIKGKSSEPEGRATIRLKNCQIQKLEPKFEGLLNGEFQHNSFSFQGAMQAGDQPALHIRGELPFSTFPTPNQLVSDLPLSLELESQIGIATLMQLFNFEIEHPFEGDLNIRCLVDGTFQSPHVNGHITLKNGTFENVRTGAVFQDIYAQCTCTSQSLSLHEFHTRDPYGGEISGSGTLHLLPQDNYPFSANFELKNLNFFQLDRLTSSFSGKVDFEGNRSEGTLRGRLMADNLQVRIPERSRELLDSVQVTYINIPEGDCAPQVILPNKELWPIFLALEIEIPQGEITGSNLNSWWKGLVHVKGTNQIPLLFGDYKLISGQYLFNGKDFELKEGHITFSGEFDKKTTLYVIASKDLDKVMIDVILRGPMKTPAISFRSNPPLSQREILSWLLFNRGINEINSFHGTQVSESITNLSSPRQGTDFLTKIRNITGLDRIDICREECDAGEMTIQVGKYLSKGVYISVSKSDVNKLAIEASLRHHLKLQAELGDDSEGQIQLKWKKDY